MIISRALDHNPGPMENEIYYLRAGSLPIIPFEELLNDQIIMNRDRQNRSADEMDGPDVLVPEKFELFNAFTCWRLRFLRDDPWLQFHTIGIEISGKEFLLVYVRGTDDLEGPAKGLADDVEHHTVVLFDTRDQFGLPVTHTPKIAIKSDPPCLFLDSTKPVCHTEPQCSF